MIQSRTPAVIPRPMFTGDLDLPSNAQPTTACCLLPSREMSEPVNTYFLCPNFDTPPEAIALGQVITDPADPTDALNVHDLEPPRDTFYNIKRNWESDIRQVREGRVDVFAKFLQVLGIGGDISFKSPMGEGAAFLCDELQTNFFVPTHEYLQSAMKSKGVKRFLEASRYKKPLYIVTGLKIARGASCMERSSMDGTAKLVVEEGIAVGLATGPGASLARDTIHWQIASDFVFAYQLRKVAFKKVDSLNPYGEPPGSRGRVGSDLKAVIDAEDPGAESIKDVVVENVLDDNKEQSPSVVMYSAEIYKKGAIF
jgi:hypothetical protein